MILGLKSISSRSSGLLMHRVPLRRKQLLILFPISIIKVKSLKWKYLRKRGFILPSYSMNMWCKIKSVLFAGANTKGGRLYLWRGDISPRKKQRNNRLRETKDRKCFTHFPESSRSRVRKWERLFRGWTMRATRIQRCFSHQSTKGSQEWTCNHKCSRYWSRYDPI